MKAKGEIRKGITKGDIALIVSLCFLCVALFVVPLMGENSALRADIYLEGEKTHSIVLGEAEDEYTINVGGCEILIESDGVTFLSSECEDQLCVKKGKLKRKGDSMACVPEKVVISIASLKGENPDGIAY